MVIRIIAVLALAGSTLAGCGSITQPAAVRLDDGETYIGTTTAAMSGGTFAVTNAAQSNACNGTYNALDTNPTISAPFRCSDGRFGTITVTRNPDMQSGFGTLTMADGKTGRVAFGSSASSVVHTSTTSTTYADAPSSYGSYSSASYSSGQSGNCPTPESIAADGKRCGARSAASRPGGYSSYRSTYSGGTVYVRGHYRNGHYVRGHTRRRK